MAKLLTLVASTALAVTVALPGPALATTDESHPECSQTATAATPMLLGATCSLTIDCPAWAFDCDVFMSGDVAGIGMVDGTLVAMDGGQSPAMCAGWLSCTLPTTERFVHGGTQFTVLCAANGVAVFETVHCAANIGYIVP
jgi:hypothetical protein